MIDSVSPTETDLALVEALQIAPRAPWSAVGKATGMSPVSAARRWQRLVRSGTSWVTGAPGVSVWNAQCVAYVDISCVPGQSGAVAETLARDRHALSVELIAGSADIFLTVAAADLLALSRYLLGRVDLIHGITQTRTRICTRLYRDGSRWRLGALSPQAASALPDTSPPAPGHAGAFAPLQAGDRRILVQLGLDGRSSYAALGASAEVSEATARRRTARLLRSGAVLLRAEVAGQAAGWTVPVTLFIDAPTSRLAQTARGIVSWSQVRMCATLAGAPPIVASAWLHDVEAIHEFETALATSMPDLTVVDRRITLRTVKRMGRLLDEDGRAVGAVPMDVWTDPLAVA